MRCTSGLFWVIALAIACIMSVLPAFAGETISARGPFPMGASRSMIRVVRFPGSVSSRSRSCGYSGVSLPNSGRCLASAGSAPLTVSTRTSGLNFSRRSPSRGCRIAPLMASPLRSPYFLTMERET